MVASRGGGEWGFSVAYEAGQLLDFKVGAGEERGTTVVLLYGTREDALLLLRVKFFSNVER